MWFDINFERYSTERHLGASEAGLQVGGRGSLRRLLTTVTAAAAAAAAAEAAAAAATAATNGRVYEGELQQAVDLIFLSRDLKCTIFKVLTLQQ